MTTTADHSTSVVAPLRTSITEALEWIDPTSLPPDVQQTLRQIGPFLASGLSHREIGERIGRSEDFVSVKVAEVRRAMVEAALARCDGMRESLRVLLEQHRGG